VSLNDSKNEDKAKEGQGRRGPFQGRCRALFGGTAAWSRREPQTGRGERSHSAGGPCYMAAV